MARKRPRVVMAEDHTLVGEGLGRILREHFNLVATVEDGLAAVKAAARLRPDVVLLDISMPLMNGYEAARQIKTESPDIKIVFVTMHGDLQYVLEALSAGASGYVLKKSAVSELKTAVEEALKGNTYVTPLVPKWQDALAEWKPEALTTRQRQVLQLVAEGNSAKQIASVLGISVKTAEFHKAAIMQKLKLRTTAELTRYALRHGLIANE